MLKMNQDQMVCLIESRKVYSIGNYVAIGTFDPQVEIWDLDIIDAVFPEVILGQIPSINSGIKSGKSKHGTHLTTPPLIINRSC
jgi:hypothetical protein